MLVGLIGLIAVTGCAELGALDAATLKGVLQEVDTVSGEVTVQLKDGTTTTFNLEDVDIQALSNIIGQASLQVGDEVSLNVSASNEVQSVATTRAKLEGAVTSVDREAHQLTVEAASGVSLTVQLTLQTRIEFERGGGNATVDDLVPGTLVEVRYDTSNNEAIKVEIENDHSGHGRSGEDRESEEHGRNHEDGDEDEIEGIIRAIDDVLHTVTVEHENGTEATYTVVSDSELDIDGSASFAELTVGMNVEIEFDPETLEIEELEVKDEDDEDDDE